MQSVLLILTKFNKKRTRFDVNFSTYFKIQFENYNFVFFWPEEANF